MLFLWTHLLPTAASGIFALQFIVTPSLSTFVAYVIAAFLGGVVSAAETMATDNRQLASLEKAVRDLGITNVKAESFRQLLPASVVHFLERRILKEKRPPDCIFLNSSPQRLKHARAFAFFRFFPICLHSFGEFKKFPKSMILYHELGHLFFMQPRGGHIALVFGSTIPLFWMIYSNPSREGFEFAVLFLLFGSQYLTIRYLNSFEREVFADAFALASKFTEAWQELSEPEIDIAMKRGWLFETQPENMKDYGSIVSARSKLRGLKFNKAFDRMNTLGRLNEEFLKNQRLSSGIDHYWNEVFYRRALQTVISSPRLLLSALNLAAIIYMFVQLDDLLVPNGALWVMFLCAIAVLIILAITASKLGPASSMVAQAKHRAVTSLVCVEWAAEENVQAKASKAG